VDAREFSEALRVDRQRPAPNHSIATTAPRDHGATISSRLRRSGERPFTSRRIVLFMARVRPDDLVALQGLIEAGKVTAAIDRESPLHEVPDAIRYVHSGQGRAKVVIGIRE
jgi:hypothetical protein